MRCLNCGSHDHPPDARFCGHCGEALAAPSCTQCGRSLRPGDKFCPHCGSLVSIEARVSPGSTRPPITFTPAHLIDRFLAARATVEGELKHATVLFADIVDSTQLTFGKDPEAANEVLGPAVEVMRRSVFRYEGYVRPRGDGIQALFGVPLSHEDHAVRGCLAALDIIAGIKALDASPNAGGPVQVRVGLNSGEIIVKRISDDLLLELDAIGVTVALASRMERLAAPNTALITAATFALVERLIGVSSRGKVTVRGVAEPVEIFCLEGVRQAPQRFSQPADGSVTTFVGRALELETLAYAWEEATKSRGQIVAFVGEPGVGKSRLIAEFTRSHRFEGALLLEARSVSYGRATPYLPVIHLLRAYFGIHADDDVHRAKDKIDAKLQALGSSLPDHRAAIFDLLAIEESDARWRDFDPSERRQKLQEGVLDVVLREARSRPVCLVFEDLHWVDNETREFLSKLVEFIPTRRILLLVNYRPEYQCDWGRKTYFRQLPVTPLSAASSHKLLDNLLGTFPQLKELKLKLIEQTAGNPLFLEECVNMLKAQTALQGEPGAAKLVRPLDQISFLPASVQSTLKARIDQLDAEPKHVLEYASVFGKDFSYANLKAVVGLDAQTLEKCLRELQDLEFIYQTQRLPEPEFTFKHALTYQVAYRSLLNERRRTIHADILQSMEQRYQKRIGDHVEELARHALHGEVWGKAFKYAYEAAKKAFDRSAHRETVQHLEDALRASQNLGEPAAGSPAGIDVRFLMRYALLNLGEIERVRQLLSETEPLIRALDVPQRTAQFEGFQSNYFCLTDDQPNAVAHGLSALRIAESIQDRVLRVEMAYRLAQPYYQLAKYAEAIELLEAAVGLIAASETRSRLGMAAIPVVVCRTWLTLCYAELGEFGRAARNAGAAVALASETGHPLSSAFAYWGQGHYHLYQRSYQDAAVVLEKGLEVCRRWDLRFWFSRLASALGLARAMTGETETALELIDQALDDVLARHYAVDAARLFERLATAHLAAGRYDLAESKALHALSLSTRSNARGHQAWSMRLLGEIYTAIDSVDRARADENFNAALGLANTLGMRPLAAHCYEGISRLHARRGDQLRAEQARSKASEIWSSLGSQS
jgi:class 3 adenylate cyclase/tetratricopeptide (TPR) repeat protein